ncbi:MAG: hypothetical protein M1824_003006 [Vezdaea acicularis]|nr:MAG: hypothetical protein M1824_003006 [Vezdaea acicularis]
MASSPKQMRFTRRMHGGPESASRPRKRLRSSTDDDFTRPGPLKKLKVESQAARPKAIARKEIPSGRVPRKYNLKATTPPSPPNGTIARDPSEPALRPTKRARVHAPAANGIIEKEEKTSSETANDKRKLRSQDGGSRFKSDLSLYFPAYEEMISNEPKEPDFLTPETPIYVVDTGAPLASTRIQNLITPKSPSGKRGTPGSSAHGPRNSMSNHNTSLKRNQDLNNAQRIDFTSIAKAASKIHSDPLSEATYQKAHKKAERQEKQLRNIEKERAQHEKYHLERLLQSLKGHDWLRTMGITGITETEKKEYEPKRDMFIREVTALIAKFKVWKEEEKRRKQEKDAAAKEAGLRSQPETPTAEDSRDASETPSRVQAGPKLAQSAEPISDGDPPGYGDLDAEAARQLHVEAMSATKYHLHPSVKQEPAAKKRRGKAAAKVEEPFTSFYKKPHERAATLGTQRRSGRKASAFGKPLPHVSSEEFALPQDVLTPDAKRASARARRAAKRQS